MLGRHHVGELGIGRLHRFPIGDRPAILVAMPHGLVGLRKRGSVSVGRQQHGVCDVPIPSRSWPSGLLPVMRAAHSAHRRRCHSAPRPRIDVSANTITRPSERDNLTVAVAPPSPCGRLILSARAAFEPEFLHLGLIRGIHHHPPVDPGDHEGMAALPAGGRLGSDAVLCTVKEA